MDETCQFLEGCPMFELLYRYAQRVYIDMYCQGNYARCRRRKLRLAGGTVPNDLLPYGGRLSTDDQGRPVW